MTKVSIRLSEPDRPYGFENLWAEPVSGGLYRLRNVPVFAYGFSEQDVVSVVVVEDRLVVSEVIERGGHSTYRVFLPEPVSEDRLAEVWQPFHQFGCTYERATKRAIAIDVPPSADIDSVFALLEQGEAQGLWQFDEGHCARIH